MKIIKVFNNNSVSAILPGGREAILLGNGIGFHKRSGEAVDESRVEKVYYVQTEMQTKFLEMLQDVQPDVMEAAEQIISLAEAEGFVLSSQGTISLVDHITFAIERQEKSSPCPTSCSAKHGCCTRRNMSWGRRRWRSSGSNAAYHFRRMKQAISRCIWFPFPLTVPRPTAL